MNGKLSTRLLMHTSAGIIPRSLISLRISSSNGLSSGTSSISTRRSRSETHIFVDISGSSMRRPARPHLNPTYIRIKAVGVYLGA
jgi:hypothetical protein